MKNGILILIMVLMWGCGVRKSEGRRTEQWVGNSSVRISETRTGERLTVRDSVVRVRAPVEESRNVGTDSSFVQTSLAWSVAVWKDGQLRHTIGNYPSMAATIRTVYRDRWQTVRDTLVVRDTVRTKESVIEKIVKASSWWDKWWSVIGQIMVLIMAGHIVWRKLRPK